MCCDTVNRGVAYGDGKIFLNQADTTLVALDAKTGKVVWSVKNGDPTQGRDRHDRADHRQGQGPRRHFRRRVRRPRPCHRLQFADGKLAWRAYSTGPDDEHPDRSGENHRARQAGRQGFSSSRPGKASSGRSAAARPGAGISYDPELNLSTTAPATPSTWNPVAAARRQSAGR